MWEKVLLIPVFAAVVSLLASSLLGALFPSLTVRLLDAKDQLLTIMVPARRRSKRLRDLAAMRRDERRRLEHKGFRPSEVAWRLLIDGVRGFTDDLGWWRENIRLRPMTRGRSKRTPRVKRDQTGQKPLGRVRPKLPVLTVADPNPPVIGSLAGQKLWALIIADAQGEAELLVAHNAFVLGLKLREIYERYPQHFVSIADVYRVKRTLVNRLSCNPAIRDFGA